MQLRLSHGVTNIP
jgi:hypothetical protein